LEKSATPVPPFGIGNENRILMKKLLMFYLFYISIPPEFLMNLKRAKEEKIG
jgi:hypothetical protein